MVVAREWSMSRAAVALAMFQPGFRNWSKTLVSGYVKVFGRRPSRTFPRALRPASENLQGTKPRERARIGRCRVLSYGDLAVGVPQLRSAARRAERWGWRCSSVGRRFSDLRAGMSLKIGAAVAWWTQRWSELSRGGLRSEQTGERLFGVVALRLS